MNWDKRQIVLGEYVHICQRKEKIKTNITFFSFIFIYIEVIL